MRRMGLERQQGRRGVHTTAAGWLAGSGMGALRLRGPRTGKGRQARAAAAWRSHEVWTNQSSRLSSYVRVRCILHLDTAAGSRGMQLCIANNSNSDAC